MTRRKIHTSNAPTNLDYIDGLRGLAILMVIADHIRLFSSGILWKSDKFFELAMATGQRGVQLFFLVSAFTLFRSFSFRSGNESRPVLSFYLRRIFRIQPLWWLAILFYAWWKNDFSPGRLIANLTMFFGFIRYRQVEIINVQWSLFIEEMFYLVFPLMFASLTSTTKALRFFLASYALSYLWLRLAPIAGIPSEEFFISRFPFAHYYSFALGIMMFHLLANKEVQTILQDRKHRATLTVASTLVILETFNKAHPAGVWSMFAVFVLSAANIGPIGWITRNQTIKTFGICCYGLYLFHMAGLEFLEPFRMRVFAALGIERLAGEISFLPWFATFSFLALVVCWTINRLIEKPAIALGAKLIARLQQRAERSQPPKALAA